MHDPIWQTALEQLCRVQRDVPKRLVDAAHAEVYAWADEPASAVRYLATQVKSDAVFPEPPSRVSWWWFEKPLVIYDSSPLDALLIEPCDRQGPRGPLTRITPFTLGQIVQMWPSVEAGRGDSRVGYLHLNRPLPALPPELESFLPLLAKFVVAGCLWLNERVSSGHIERHARKRLGRTYRQPIPATVKVVELRRAGGPEPPREHRATATEWSRQWIVREHIRNQPYKDGHRPKLIEAYVKGPADKPLHVPSHTVYSVTR